VTQTPRQHASDGGTERTHRLRRVTTRRQVLRFRATAGAAALAGCDEPLEYTRSVEVYNGGRTTHEFTVDATIDEERVFGETLPVGPGERRTFEGALDDALSERESGLFRLRTVMDGQTQVTAEVDIETEFRPTGVSTGLDTLSEPQLVAKISEPFEFGGAADRYAYTAGYNHVEIFDTPWCRNIPRSYSR
jgi:hypothetical protein